MKLFERVLGGRGLMELMHDIHGLFIFIYKILYLFVPSGMKYIFEPKENIEWKYL